MAKTDYQSVAQYVAAQPKDVRSVLKTVRTIVRKAIPGADETISYQIPAYKREGRTVMFFAGWKEHYSIYPVSKPLLVALKEDLAPYKISKGTIRFPISEPVPAKLIERIARVLWEEAGGRGRAAKRRPAARRTRASRKRPALS